MNIATCRLMGLALGAHLPPLDIKSVTMMIITFRVLSAQGVWVLEQSRKEAEMAVRTNGIGSSPVRD